MYFMIVSREEKRASSEMLPWDLQIPQIKILPPVGQLFMLYKVIMTKGRDGGEEGGSYTSKLEF